MKWEDIKNCKPPVFKRLTGVSKETFMMMSFEVNRLSPASIHKIQGAKRGPKPKLSTEDKLLMMLMYYREYRTFFHTAGSYGISEGQCFRIIVKLENILIQSGLFKLPGKKALLPSQHDWEVVLIDVSESSVERPKKNSGAITQGKRKGTL